MFTRHTFCALFAVVAALATPALAPAADPFADTFKGANKKLVKVFGAGGFSRLNNFGTGIVISKDGYILTVASQLLDTADLVVHTYEGDRLRAVVVATEPDLDVALLKIKTEKPLDLKKEEYFDYFEAAKRPVAEPGDWVLALSNTFEIALRDEPLSIQRGVVSAYTKMAGRRGVFEFPYTGDVYVVDAITNNPGAAGGALLNRKGELIGIIGREIKNTQSETWMNYAVPINASVKVKRVFPVNDKDGKPTFDKDGKPITEEKEVTLSIQEVVTKKEGYTQKGIKTTVPGGTGGYSGIIFVPDILDRTPAYIEDVVPDSPAAKAGLMPDDLVSFIDGEPIISIKAFHKYLRENTRAGTKIRLEVRRGEALQTVEIELGSHPVKPAPPAPPAPPKP